MKTSIRSLATVTLAIAGFSYLSDALAVVPAPDGGYPGSNTAEGQGALFSLTGGVHNTALGFQALFHNSGGTVNVATGSLALHDNTTGKRNTASGFSALSSNTTGFGNTATGCFALSNNLSSNDNTADGFNALLSNTTGFRNTAVGQGALFQNVGGDDNTAVGRTALFSNMGGNSNTAVGASALGSNQTGYGVTSARNVICVGAQGADVDDSCFIGNIYGVTTQSGTTLPVVVSDSGQLGTVASSQRFKKDISNMDKASEALLSLRPVTFHYRSDANRTPQFGLIAEEVANVDADLVVRDKEGKPYTVRYEAVNAMLLNEFLKEHHSVQEQKATIAQLKEDFQSKLAEQQKQIQALTAGLQKVSADIERSKAMPGVVSNNP